MTTATTPDAHLAATHERINGIERSNEEFRRQTNANFASINTSLDGISKDINSKNRTPWGVIFTGLGVLVAITGGFGGLVYGPMKEGQTRIESAIEKMADHTVSEKEFTTSIAVAKDRRDDAQRVTEDRFKRLESDVDRLQGSIVPRGEHDQKWVSQQARDAELQRQIDDARGRLESIYTPKDQLSTLQRHVEELEGRLLKESRP